MSVLKEIEKLALDFNSSLDDLKKELKKVQSQKCRLIKQKTKKGYETEMTKVIKYEQALKEARNYLEPKKITVTTMTKSDIELLNFDETMKAIRSIQSKKCLSQYEETMSTYDEACKIEEMLIDHKNQVKPIEETVVKKSDINDLISNLEKLDSKIDKKYIIEQLQKML